MASRSQRTKTASARTESTARVSGGSDAKRTRRPDPAPDWFHRFGPFALLVGVIVIVYGQVATF